MTVPLNAPAISSPPPISTTECRTNDPTPATRGDRHPVAARPRFTSLRLTVVANVSILAIASTPGRWFVYVEIGRGTKRLETWLPRRLRFQRVSAGLVGVFWSTRSNWVDEMRLWKAVGDASYVLVLAALALVQLTKLIPSTRPLLPWHRQIGIWFAVTATLDGALIFNGWAPWSPRRFLATSSCCNSAARRASNPASDSPPHRHRSGLWWASPACRPTWTSASAHSPRTSQSLERGRP